MVHPAIRRAWLQTGGLPVEPVHADLRAAFDQVHDVVYMGGACFRLRDRDGVQMGLIQFQGDTQRKVDLAIAETTERLAVGAPKPVDIAAGDTLIRPLDMRDPADRVLAENAISRVDSNVIIPDPERQDPPPIDLPDYVGDDSSTGGHFVRDLERGSLKRVGLFLAIVSAIGMLLVALHLAGVGK